MRAIFVFPPFRLDAANEQLWRDSNLVNLRPKTFQVLLYFVQNAQRLVPKRELLGSVWAGASVSDELLRGYIRELRDALGGSGPIHRAASTRMKCPLEKRSTFPLIERTRVQMLSARAATWAGVSPPGAPSRKRSQSGRSA